MHATQVFGLSLSSFIVWGVYACQPVSGNNTVNTIKSSSRPFYITLRFKQYNRIDPGAVDL